MTVQTKAAMDKALAEFLKIQALPDAKDALDKSLPRHERRRQLRVERKRRVIVYKNLRKAGQIRQRYLTDSPSIYSRGDPARRR